MRRGLVLGSLDRLPSVHFVDRLRVAGGRPTAFFMYLLSVCCTTMQLNGRGGDVSFSSGRSFSLSCGLSSPPIISSLLFLFLSLPLSNVVVPNLLPRILCIEVFEVLHREH